MSQNNQTEIETRFNFILNCIHNSNCDSMAEEKLIETVVIFNGVKAENERLKEVNKELFKALKLIYELINVGQPPGNDDLEIAAKAMLKAIDEVPEFTKRELCYQ